MTTRERIINAALEMSEAKGFHNITRDAVASHAKVGAGSVNVHFISMSNLRRAVLSAALTNRNLKVIAQGLAAGAYASGEVSAELKQEALNSIQ